MSQFSGKPVLPFKPVRILIPRGMEASGIEVLPGERATLSGSFTVKPGQRPVPLSRKGPVSVTPPDPAVYRSRAEYPGKRGTDISYQEKGPYLVLLMNLQPIAYRPREGRIKYFKEMTVRVALRPLRTARSGERRRGTALQRQAIRGMVANPDALGSYDEADDKRDARNDALLDSYPHVIITSQALEAAPGPYNFQALRDHRTARGLPSTIVTTEYIYANYSGTKPSGGSDNQTRIRNFIAWAHENWGTQYVLLGGYSGIIPPRMLYVQAYPGETTTMPSDLYYGNLDGTFDNDADGVYGETNDGPGGGDIDLYAEVYVGRACVENVAEVSNFVRKTLAYETSAADYLHRAYMVGEYLGFGGPADYATESMEEIRLGSSAHGYTTKGFAESEFFQTSTLYDASGYSWPKSALIAIMNSGVHILNHLGHANYTYDMKLYTSDLPSLTNTEYFFAYSQGCMPGGFDTTNCFAEQITTMEKGAFAAVMNARYGWGEYNSTAGPSQYYDREFWDALFGEGMRELGRMNADSKEDNDFRISGECMRWCYYELNLFGDPATAVQSISSRGIVSFSADAYRIPGTAVVTVLDKDLDANPAAPDTVTVAVGSTTEGTPETLLLTETGVSTKTFRGSISITGGAATPGDGVLQASDGDTLTVTYHDADDGTGNAADVQDTALADSSGPVTSNVGATPSAKFCTIRWDTNEPSTSVVRYGKTVPPGASSSSSTLVTSHSVRLSGLDPLTTYSYEVESADALGNTTVDDNGGAYYQFTTMDQGGVLFVDDDEGDPYETYFTDALDANAYSYDVWEVNAEGTSPSAADLGDYRLVVWNCGYDYSSANAGITSSEESALMTYMDGGGRVFLCGQDIIYCGVSSTFRTNYLHLASYDSDDQTAQANGIAGDRISDGMTLPLSYPFYNWSDSLNPDASSSGVFQTDGTTYPYCAIRYPADGVAGSFRIVFFAFPFEAISSSAADPNNAKTVMDRVLGFLSPVEVTAVSPAYGLNDRPTGIVITGAGFKAGLAGTIGAASLTITSVAPGQIEATVPAGLADGTHDLLVRNGDSLRGGMAAAYTAIPPAADNDQDGLSNEAEVATYGTNPFLADTDGDGLTDLAEVSTYKTDPLDADMDDDGLLDGEEIANGSRFDLADSDGDGISDYLEVMCGGDPMDGIPPSMIRVNFQPAGASRPGGNSPDSGTSYGLKGYGWIL
jgi:hypothetical protein